VTIDNQGVTARYHPVSTALWRGLYLC